MGWYGYRVVSFEVSAVYICLISAKFIIFSIRNIFKIDPRRVIMHCGILQYFALKLISYSIAFFLSEILSVTLISIEIQRFIK